MTHIIRFFSLVALAVNLSYALSTAPCKRLLMSGLENSNMIPWIQMSGLYHLHDVPNAIFPMYKHDLQDMYFYHNATANMFQFNSAAGIIKNSYYIGAFTNRTYVVTSSITPFYPFSEMITRWFQYNPITNDYVYHEKGTIQPMCVSDDVQTCFSGKIVFNQNLIQNSAGDRHTIFSTGINYFQSIPGLYINLRPVYQQFDGTDNPMSSYLFHSSNHWLVGSNYTVDSGWMKSTDYSVRPEWKSGDWWLWSDDKWNYVAGLSLKCREYPVDTCSTSSIGTNCQNGGQCTSLQTSRNSLCQCAEGFTGSFCERTILRCPEYKPDVISEYDYYTNMPTEGSLLTVWCSEKYLPGYRFAVCQSNGYGQQPSWRGMERCTFAAVFKRSFDDVFNHFDTTTNSGPFPDKFNVWLIPVVCIIAILGTLLTPIVVYLCTRCIRRRKLKAVRNMDYIENYRLEARFRQQMEEFKLRHPQAEAYYDAETRLEFEVLKKNQEQERTELIAKQTKRQTKTGSIKLTRICSLCLYISWCFWVAVVAILFTFKFVALGTVFLALTIIACVFGIILPIYVLIESCCIAERHYLSNLDPQQSSTQAIESFRRTQPYVGMYAVCYHYETRTRDVEDTDSDTETESYQEKVVTNKFKEEFVYRFWNDTSEPILQSIRSKGVTKMKMKLNITFGDFETKSAFYSQYSTFQDKHRNKDTCVDFRESFQLPGFRNRLCTFADSKPWWIGMNVYMIASMFMLTWPYRFFFNRAAGRIEYNVNKVVYFHRPVGAVDMSGFSVNAMLPLLDPLSGGIVNAAQSPPPSFNLQGMGIVNGAQSPPAPFNLQGIGMVDGVQSRPPPFNPQFTGMVDGDQSPLPPFNIRGIGMVNGAPVVNYGAPPYPPRERINGAQSNNVDLMNSPGTSEDMVVHLQRGHSLMPRY